MRKSLRSNNTLDTHGFMTKKDAAEEAVSAAILAAIFVLFFMFLGHIN
ncbi:unnamed protein product [marine sediment metagenome]|uniref:Uncharacterized protein n=1 Tax=marine sediment metagenome TaxID=412755 RepID=X1HAA0_9ZZZZ